MTKLTVVLETLRDLSALDSIVKALGGTRGDAVPKLENPLPGLGAAFQTKTWVIEVELSELAAQDLAVLLSGRIKPVCHPQQ